MIYQGDCLEILPTLEPKSVQCCVTSPPYYGLRDYGCDGQIGLESTPEVYVEKLVSVFREVRRVLADDGTLWLNLGDSYSGAGWRNNNNSPGDKQKTNQGTNISNIKIETGLKPKDLVGIPWRVAFALQQPYYTGKIKNEHDRVWLAAMIDTEGCICGSEYETGGKNKTNLYISITNSSVPIIEKCVSLFPQIAKNIYEKDGVVNSIVYRWDVERLEQKSLFIQEIYPYLVAKKKQAILGYTFLDLQRGLSSKKKGYLPEQQEKRSWLIQSLSALNHGKNIDMPSWVKEPPSLYEPGYYLRQDIIWAKPNPMPESVTDRCTKSHEYIFLLTKSARYYYDNEAVKERQAESSAERALYGWNGRNDDGSNGARTGAGIRKMKESGMSMGEAGLIPLDGMRNKRSVWTVTTQPYKEAHFATFPEEIPRTCILAGSKKGDTILDPFSGAGTTGVVAEKLNRKYIGIELNPQYTKMSEDRIYNVQPLFAGLEL